ncbi:BMC domain-containing protein [Brachyspira intermedia]|uniref:BMC domain-containing protein n=1 Tax=Brachyspira intermedia TaxID=84377 RepID=UPI0030059E16
MEYAIGMIETYGDVAVIEAVDVALKSSNISSPIITYVGGGIVTVSFYGDVASVRVAVDCGVAASEKVGVVLTSHVIARLSEEVFNILFENNSNNIKKEEFSSNSIDNKANVDNLLNNVETNQVLDNNIESNYESNTNVEVNDMNVSDSSENLFDNVADKKVSRKRKKKK